MTPASEFVKPLDLPKYFAVDIDGTILASYRNALVENIEAFKKAKALGYNLFFCTGRPQNASANLISPDFTDQTGYNGYPGVYYNGALVLDSDGSPISRIAFSKKFIEDLLEFIIANDYGKLFMFFDANGSYTIDDYDLVVEANLKKFDIRYEPKIITPQELNKHEVICISSARSDTLDGFKGYIPGVDYIPKVDDEFVDINPPGVTKARGVSILCERYGVEPSEIAFIGDGFNDIEIMQLSKFSFAMGNASDEVKKHAKYVLEHTCDEAGFAKAMSIVYGV
ncbi:bifunctional HAD superfamily/HAD-superfamily hydrolase [Babesia duncani]|uniref:Bifunctional HAD superfamily/HAD-superfamily hydrolase n=1 Tax=Babesia duncani TaxID=323732 RepID=A0AAD9PMT0_9APIC|nr:bifunctional HAD superfamily/HAD-superfamily hydrolase [Babesia duncani]